MSSADKIFYSVETNVFLDWQARYYPTDIFLALQNSVSLLVKEKRFYSPKLVEEELKFVSVTTSELLAWVKNQSGLFIPLKELAAEALNIQSRFPGLLDPKAEHEEADAYVIALAKMRNGTVVTQETSASEKRNPPRSHYIPDVCRELGIPCFNFLGLMRREKWKF